MLGEMHTGACTPEAGFHLEVVEVSNGHKDGAW